jgi:hypothetical protein
MMKPWLNRVTEFPGNNLNIRDNFATLFVASGMPDDVALFRRPSPDGRHAYWLLTPAASHFGRLLDGEWNETIPFGYDWELLVGRPSAAALLSPDR